jgi:hypothetical protein
MPALSWLTKTFVAGVLAAGDLNQFRDNFAILEKHRHGGGQGEGASLLSTSSNLGVFEHLQLQPYFPKSATGFTYGYGSSNFPSSAAQSAAQNDEIVFPVGLKAGTWTLSLYHGKATSFGIGTFYLGVTSIGTIDFYAGSTLFRQFSSIAGISVASSGWYDLKMLMATKNGSSSGYGSGFNLIDLRRTGS